jgi:hypothetical protein
MSEADGIARADTALTSITVEPLELGSVLEEVRLPEKVVADKAYAMLGVRWWGEGAFIRERKLGRDLRAKTVFRVTADSLIYNRLFAFRGSFAVTQAEHDGCYVSGEFPTFRARAHIKTGTLLCRYVAHALNSPQFLSLIDAESTGSTKTSRNRFNQRVLLSLTMPIPTDEAGLQKAVDILDAATSLRREQMRALELSKELWAGVYTYLPGPNRP